MPLQTTHQNGPIDLSFSIISDIVMICFQILSHVYSVLLLEFVSDQ